MLASYSDVIAAISMLVDQHKLQRRGLPAVVLMSQLHTVLKDRTASDRELDELRRRGEVRTFRMPTGGQATPRRGCCCLQAAQPAGRSAAPPPSPGPATSPQGRTSMR